MKAHLTAALAICLLSVSVVEGQTISEQLQRAIYTQSMLGDLDGAIRLYQQIIATSPANSEVRTQAERLLAAAEAYRRVSGPPALATFDGRVYRHLRTNITFDVPSGWNVEGTYPSSDNGEQVYINIPYSGPSKLPAQASVWMITLPAAIDEATIEQQLNDAPFAKLRQRSQAGYLNLDDWRLREDSIKRAIVGGKQVVGALADYSANGRAMVEYMVWVVTNKSRAFFAFRVTAEDWSDGAVLGFSEMWQSARVP